jgi:hypothetical protein
VFSRLQATSLPSSIPNRSFIQQYPFLGINKAPLQRKTLMLLWWDESWGTLVIIQTEHFNNLYGMFYLKFLIWSCNFVQKQTVCLLFVVALDMYVAVINALQVFRL